MRSIIIFITVTLLINVAFWGCGNRDNEKPEDKHDEQSRVVRLSKESINQINLETETVSMKPFTGYLSIPAKVITDQDNEAQIGSLVQGRVHRVFVKAGDYVKAGQILMTIEGIDVGQIKSGFLKAKASFNYAKANYERQKKLFDEKVGSQKSLLECQAEYEKALAEFQAEDKRIHSVGFRDEDISGMIINDEHTSGTLPIKSSISGVVVERNVVIGQLVDAAATAFKIINTNSVWVDGQIYEKDLAKINQKTNAEFTSATYRNEKFTGRIIYIGQIVDEHSRTITVRGEFANSNNKLKPQMYGELKIPVSANVKAIMIPAESVVKEMGREYVFIQLSDSTFEQRNVISGITADERIEIKEGLKEGERVVSKGVFYLKSELKKEELSGD
jgi:membrane fusion protein, heavy metal efflux system